MTLKNSWDQAMMNPEAIGIFSDDPWAHGMRKHLFVNPITAIFVAFNNVMFTRFTTHDWEWCKQYTTCKNGDDWGMVYYCFIHITVSGLSRSSHPAVSPVPWYAIQHSPSNQFPGHHLSQIIQVWVWVFYGPHPNCRGGGVARLSACPPIRLVLHPAIEPAFGVWGMYLIY